MQSAQDGVVGFLVLFSFPFLLLFAGDSPQMGNILVY